MSTDEIPRGPKLMLKSTKDALLIIEAAERGLFPRLVRRLKEDERAQSIYSGAVFVYDEVESQIRRFTDTLIWSPSRIVGNYLVYREMKKHEPRPTSRAGAALPPQPASARSLARPRPDTVLDQNERERKRREQLYVGSLTHSSKFKPDGLVKRTFSLMTEGKHIHVIGYYTYEDALNERFITPSEHPEFAHLAISQQLLRDRSLYRVPPRIEQLANGQLAYVGEDTDKPTSPLSESASLEADRGSPSASSSTGGTPGVSALSLPTPSTANIQPQEDLVYNLPPLRPYLPKRAWAGASVNNLPDFGDPAYSYHARPNATQYSFPATTAALLNSTSALSTSSIPSLSPPPSSTALRIRDTRQHPYPANQGRPRAHNLNVARSLRESEYTPTNPSFAPAIVPEFTPMAPPSVYHEQSVTWPAAQMGLDKTGFDMGQDQFSGEITGNQRVEMGIMGPVSMRTRVIPQFYEYEVGPSGETVEYDAPAGRYGTIEDARMG